MLSDINTIRCSGEIRSAGRVWQLSEEEETVALAKANSQINPYLGNLINVTCAICWALQIHLLAVV